MNNKNIYKKLMEVQAELKAPKSQRNDFGKYNYRNAEDILEAVKPLLKKEGLIINITDNIELIGDRYYVKATVKIIDIETGDIVETSALAREDIEKKGMDLAMVTGSCSSYARKYALNGMFAIDSSELDPDKTHTFGKSETSSVPTRKLSEAQVDRLYKIANKAGFDAETVKAHIMKKFNKSDVYTLTRNEYDTVCNGYIAKAS